MQTEHLSNPVYFSIAHNSKQPVVSSWQNLEHTKLIQKKSNLNVGLLTGRRAGFFVLDLDCDKEQNKAEFKNGKFIAEYGSVDEFIKQMDTYTVKSPNGYHIYFKYEEEFSKRSVNRKEHVDIISNNSFIMCPPSVINGKKYELIRKTSVKRIPTDVKMFILHNIYSPQLTSEDYRYMITPQEYKQYLYQLGKEYYANSHNWHLVCRATTYIAKYLNHVDGNMVYSIFDEWSKQDLESYNSTKNKEIFIKLLENTQFQCVEWFFNQLDSEKKRLSLYYRYKTFSNKVVKKVDEKINRPYLTATNHGEYVEFFEKGVNYAVKSGAGTGKTTAANDLFSRVDDNFLSVVSRILLGKQQMRSLPKTTKFYQDNKFKQGDSIVITPESIVSLNSYKFDNYIVFLDEFNSILEHCLSSTTLYGRRPMSFITLIRALTTCKQFIVVDADLSQDALYFLKLLKLDYKYVKNDFNRFNGVKTRFVNDEQAFRDELVKHDKFLLASDSKTKADIVNELIALNVIKDQKDKKLDNILILTAESEDKDYDLDEYDIIIFSPKVIYGIDSVMERPVFGYFKGHTITPPQMVQQLNRCRNPKHITIFFDYQKGRNSTYESLSQVKSFMATSIKDYYELVKFVQDTYPELQDEEVEDKAEEEMDKVKRIFKRLYRNYLYKIDCYKTNPKIHMIKQLVDSGYDVEYNLTDTITRCKDKEIKETIKEKQLENFDPESINVKKINKYLDLHDGDIEKYKEYFINKSKLCNLFNFNKFFRQDDKHLLMKAIHKGEFDVINAKSSSRKLVLLNKMIDTLNLKRTNLEYNIKKTTLEVDLTDEYRTVYDCQRRSKVDLSTDKGLYYEILKVYKSMFGKDIFMTCKKKKVNYTVEFNQDIIDEMEYLWSHKKKTRSDDIFIDDTEVELPKKEEEIELDPELFVDEDNDRLEQ